VGSVEALGVGEGASGVGSEGSREGDSAVGTESDWRETGRRGWEVLSVASSFNCCGSFVTASSGGNSA
jgi:hypothetical protein